MQRLQSVRELRVFLGYESDASVYRLVTRGEIAFVRVGRRMMFEPQAIAEFLDARRRKVLLNDDGPEATGPSVRAVPAVVGGGDDSG